MHIQIYACHIYLDFWSHDHRNHKILKYYKIHFFLFCHQFPTGKEIKVIQIFILFFTHKKYVFNIVVLGTVSWNFNSAVEVLQPSRWKVKIPGRQWNMESTRCCKGQCLRKRLGIKKALNLWEMLYPGRGGKDGGSGSTAQYPGVQQGAVLSRDANMGVSCGGLG